MIKLKELKDYFITVPKTYIVKRESYIKNVKFLFAQEEDLKFFQANNLETNCFLLQDLKNESVIILNNKLAYYQYIFLKLDESHSIYMYNDKEIENIDENTNLTKISKKDAIYLNNSHQAIFYDFLINEQQKKFLFKENGGEKYLELFSLAIEDNIKDNIENNSVIVLIPPGGNFNSIDFSLIRVARYLKSIGKKPILVAFKATNFKFTDDFEEIFLEQDISSFIQRIASIKKEKIFYRGWMHNYAMGGFLVNYFQNVVVCIKDWNFANKQEYAFLFGEDGMYDFWGIEQIFQKATRVLSHYTKEEAKRWALEYDVEESKFLFFPEYCSKIDAQVPLDRKMNHLVWAGSVPPTCKHEKHYVSKDLYKSMKAVSRKGTKIDFVLPPSVYEAFMRNDGGIYDDYLYENEFNDNFNLVKGKELSSESIEKYTYGIFPLCYENKHERLFEYAIPSKFAFYLEANLPIIVNEKMKAIAKIVQENNLGIVITNQELDFFEEIISYNQKFYDIRVENVKKYKNIFSYKEEGKFCKSIFNK